MRIAITGDGLVSALGLGVAECMANLYAGVIQPIGAGRVESTLKEAPPVFAVAAELAEAAPGTTRTARLALLATREALVTAGLFQQITDAAPAAFAPAVPARVGITMGTTVGCTFNDEAFYRAFRLGQRPSSAPIETYLASDLASLVAREVGAEGPRATVANACASGTDAIGLGARWLDEGRCDLVLAGGADALTRFPYLGFATMNSSRERCRPFDVGRQGLNLGEGAGILVLEREADARRRGARVLGLVAGYGASADAYHATAPHPEGRGLRHAIAQALVEAELEAQAIGIVNAHGTGTRENDRVEGKALFELFPHAPAVFSTKGYTGHTTGAAGAIEAIFTVRNLLDGRVPRSGGLETPDPECLIRPTEETRAVAARAALSDSLAFGGANAALVFLRGDAP